MKTKPILPNSLRLSTITGFFLKLLGVGLLFLMHTFLSRQIGSEGYGTFSYTLALTGLLAVIVPLGLPTALVRFIVEYQEKEQWNLFHGVILRSNQIVLASSILTALVLWLIANSKSTSDNLSVSLNFAILIVPLIAFIALHRKAFQGLQKPNTGTAFEEVFLPFTVLTGLFLFPIITASEALSIYVIASFIVLIISSIKLRLSLPPQSLNVPPHFRTRIWIAVALPMVFGQVSQTILNRTDILMLGVMTDMDEVGFYSAANRLAVLNTFVLSVVNTIATPKLAVAYYNHQPQKFQAIRSWMIKLSILGALPLFLLIMIWPKFLLSFFGTEFTQGNSLLRILNIGQFINAVTGPVGFILLMTGREKQFALSMAVVAMINMFGNFLLIPLWESLGAALMTATGVALLNGWQFWISKSILSTENI